ncbi:trypsin-like peptidase domain-containing protein [Microvirga sp. BT688]|uniref:VMAP-C domain-containing protein n=1 Tax=Microvirga sp. TaxID=1873136 RepID=UPI001688C320|nr:trypsin-like serine protease [Microvirga sp.]MBD2746693.1 trypsin-like peptidase domain-containing protein [Microvirga sp.]
MARSALGPNGWAFLDLVQIRTDDPFGSGLLVGPGIVLTALHCVADSENGWQLRSTITVNLWRDLFGLDGARPNERSYRAKVIWQPEIHQDVEPPDIALLEFKVTEGTPVPSPRRPGPLLYAELGLYDAEVVATGFPALLEGGVLPGKRYEGAFPGLANLRSLSMPTISFTSRIISSRGGKEDWSGLSGGPLFRGDALVGVMRGGQPQFKVDRNLEAEPLAPLLRDPRYNGLTQYLDAQAEASGPISPDGLAELKRIIAAARITSGAIRDAYLVSHLAAAAPYSDVPDLCSRLIDEVAAHGVSAMRTFLTHLVVGNPNVRNAIDGWVSKQPDMAGLPVGPNSSPVSNDESVTLIKVMPTAETMIAASPRERSYEVEAWVFHGPDPARRIDPGPAIREHKHSFTKLAEVIQTFVTRSLDYLPTSTVPVVELALPFDLLGEDVERWQVKVTRALHRPLGRTFPLALRSYDRLYDQQLNNCWYAWRQSWKSLPSEIGESTLHWIVNSDGWGEPLFDALSGRPLVCVALACGGTDGIGILVEAGAPVAIWLRDAPQDENATRAELRALVCGYGVHGLPNRIQNQRQERTGTAWEGVALFYDDPSRLPPDAKVRFQSME